MFSPFFIYMTIDLKPTAIWQNASSNFFLMLVAVA